MFQENQCVPDKPNFPSGSNCFGWHNLLQLILTVPNDSMYPGEPRCTSLSNLLQMNQAIPGVTLTLFSEVSWPEHSRKIVNFVLKLVHQQPSRKILKAAILKISDDFWKFLGNHYCWSPCPGRLNLYEMDLRHHSNPHKYKQKWISYVFLHASIAFIFRLKWVYSVYWPNF